MKNKKNIYFLLPAVLLIWGLLGYRIFSAVKANNTNSSPVISQVSFKPNELKESEAFTIKADYRDPFLDKIHKARKSKPRPKVPKEPQVSKPFPQIVFKGVVSSGNINQVFIISIEGKQHFFKKGQIHEGIKLISGNSKSITIKFEGQHQDFPISK